MVHESPQQLVRSSLQSLCAGSEEFHSVRDGQGARHADCKQKMCDVVNLMKDKVIFRRGSAACLQAGRDLAALSAHP